MKLIDINDNEVRRYIAVWVKGLHEMLGWTEQQTLIWAEKIVFPNGKTDPFLLHETEGHYMVNLLLPEWVKCEFQGPDIYHIKTTMRGLIEMRDSFCYEKSDFDWKFAQKRLETFFEALRAERSMRGEALRNFVEGYKNKVVLENGGKEVS